MFAIAFTFTFNPLLTPCSRKKEVNTIVIPSVSDNNASNRPQNGLKVRVTMTFPVLSRNCHGDRLHHEHHDDMYVHRIVGTYSIRRKNTSTKNYTNKTYLKLF